MPGGATGQVNPNTPYPPPRKTLFKPTPEYEYPDPEYMDDQPRSYSKVSKHPCWRAQQESFLCMEQSNFDRQACTDFFYNVKSCYKKVHESQGKWLNLGGGGKTEDAPIINFDILLQKMGLRDKPPDAKW